MNLSQEVKHLQTLNLQWPASQCQIDANGVYLAAPLSKTSVGVWSLQSLISKPLELIGHRRQITSLQLGHDLSSPLLCSCADDYVIVWNINTAREQFSEGKQIRGQIVGQQLGSVQHSSFSPDDKLVALCVGSEVLIIDSNEERLDTALEGHTSKVTCAQFCPHIAGMIISASEDRTFKIWDIINSSLVFQSSVISSYPFLSLAVDPYQDCVAFGSADGQVRVYDLSEGAGYRELHAADISKMLSKDNNGRRKETVEEGPKTISSKPSYETVGPIAIPDEEELHEEDSSAGGAVLSLHFVHSKLQGRGENRKKSSSGSSHFTPDEDVAKTLVEDSSYLLVGSPGCLVQIHAKSFESKMFNFKDAIHSEENVNNPEKTLGLVAHYTFSQYSHGSKVFVFASSYFEKSIDVLVLDLNPSKNSVEEGDLSNHVEQRLHLEDPATREITVIPSVPLTDSSVLKASMVLKSKSADKKGPIKTVGQKGVKNQPLTFQKKIKSSGYTAAPNMKMFSSPSSSKTSFAKKSNSAPVSSGSKSLYKEYPMNSELSSNLKYKLQVAEDKTPVSCVTFSDDGQHVACALGNKSAQVFKMPLNKKGTCLSGHDGKVNRIAWSHDNQWLISAADDKTAKIWPKGSSDPIMTIQTISQSHQNEETSSGKKKDVFPREILHAQFYYVDKFFLLSCGNKFHLYKYFLDSTVNDIKRYNSNSRYKLVKTVSMEKANTISCMSAANGFYSYIIICCGSDKGVEIFDMNIGERVSIIPEAHVRPVHSVAQSQGSNYASLPSSAYNIFATSAATDGIKVWDIRNNRCIRKLEGHLNRAHACGIAFSACGQFLVSGSENKCVYVYDMREGTILSKMSGQTDVVSCVACHPLYPEVLTATLDGQLSLFSDR